MKNSENINSATEENSFSNKSQKFRESIENQAKSYMNNPENYSRNDVLIDILQQNSLNAKFASNPVAKNRIIDICNTVLEKFKIGNITKENINEVKSILVTSLTISDDGMSLTYKEKPELIKGQYVTEGKHIFEISENKDFTETFLYATEDPSSRTLNNDVKFSYSKSQHIYNESGIEMKSISRHSERFGKNQISNFPPENSYMHSKIIERSNDLTTALVTIQDRSRQNMDTEFIKFNTMLHGENISTLRLPDGLEPTVEMLLPDFYDRKLNLRDFKNAISKYTGFEADLEKDKLAYNERIQWGKERILESDKKDAFIQMLRTNGRTDLLDTINTSIEKE